ncbi:alpha/beta fold hydrolase [Brevundimonas viscosa]|uniref:Proline iminopeptidase n=1 Tax=Brevundimonas viscosa TaxID=871741 RepID=A0A1I6S0Z2_9CAUL|nr:alpha/beta hydrolase [Brevundimonas viscosa]SFS70633.1 proline iminopeptidase [Brevundimonas viscosa]
MFLRPLLSGLAALALLAAATAVRASSEASLAPGAHHAVINDVRLWYRVAGREEGTPVVFLHGGPGQGSQTFARYAGPALEPRLRMVYLDQRGSGRSERPWNDAYSLELLVDDLEQLRQAWGVERISLIGHSFGTILALEYAAAHPERVERLALVAAAPDLPAAMDLQCLRLERLEPETYLRAVEARPDGSRARCNPFAAGRAFIDGAMFPEPATQRLVDESDAVDGLRNTGQIGQALFGAGGLMDYRFDRHARLTMPVLVIAGLADFQTVVEPQRDLVHDLPDARIVEYPGRGHFMFVEEPARFAADVAEFLGR